MTTIEIKNHVIEKINRLTDEELLMEVYKLLDDSNIDSEIYHLSDAHKAAIDVAIDQINSGDFLTNEEANNLVNAWLNK